MAKPKLIIEVKPWSTMELFDLRLAMEQGQTIEMTAAILGRELKEVVGKLRNWASSDQTSKSALLIRHQRLPSNAQQTSPGLGMTCQSCLHI